MKWMPTKYKEVFIEEVEYSEIDLEEPFWTGEEPNDMDELGIGDVESIGINLVINTLIDLRDKGADRVVIQTHCDHHAYIFTGIKLEKV